MLPQFGFIVAQAGADYYSTLANTAAPPAPTPPPPPPPQSQPSTAAVQPNGHSSLAPLLNNKPFGFPNGLGSSHSNNYNNVPFYSRQPSPSAQVPILPPPSFLYNDKPKDMIPPKNNMMEKNEPWYHRPMKSPPPPPPPVQQKREPSPYYTIEEELQGEKKIKKNTSIAITLTLSLDRKNNTATVRQEYNDLMTWMDNEFWEQADE
jgi:hypothetical protein